MILSMNHITLGVIDIEKSFAFYRDILQLKPLLKWDKGAYFLVGSANPDIACSGFWFCLNVDANRVPNSCYTHYAFTVAEKDFDTLSKKILQTGAPIFQENLTPGKSLYFLDPDGHKLEIHVGNYIDRINAKKMDLGSWKDVEWFV